MFKMTVTQATCIKWHDIDEINTRNGIPDNVVSHNGITTVKIVTCGAGRRGNSPSDVYSVLQQRFCSSDSAAALESLQQGGCQVRV